ncbi:hypothetical protein GGU11DRAFT_683060, partial [Lentinula aff. detonsa]
GLSAREDRRKCWEARDQYFACLDNVGVAEAWGRDDAYCLFIREQSLRAELR